MQSFQAFCGVQGSRLGTTGMQELSGKGDSRLWWSVFRILLESYRWLLSSAHWVSWLWRILAHNLASRGFHYDPLVTPWIVGSLSLISGEEWKKAAQLEGLHPLLFEIDLRGKRPRWLLPALACWPTKREALFCTLTPVVEVSSWSAFNAAMENEMRVVFRRISLKTDEICIPSLDWNFNILLKFQTAKGLYKNLWHISVNVFCS